MRQWRRAHVVEKEEVDKSRHCCVRMLCACVHCVKWLLCGCVVCCWRCMVWVFCPKYKNDGQHEFGINWHEYVAWKNEADVGKREIPYKRLGTQNYFFAGDSDSEDEDN